MKIIGLIPARGGSKRVPRKNIKEFLGKPLLAWTIGVAKASGVLDRIILSTEDEEIARVGREYGAEVPFMRPMELAQDTTPALPVVQHAVKWLLENEGLNADWVVFLEPSSPGRREFHIQEVVRLLKKGGSMDSVVGISELPGHFSPLKALKRDELGMVTRHSDGELIRNLTHRNQDLPSFYFINSAIYAFKSSNTSQDPPSLWGDKVFGYTMEPRYALDIDTPEDWIVAEAKMKMLFT